jgi:pimeloyl-ACP methyl ester carboxylesterase
MSTSTSLASSPEARAARIRFAGLAGRPHGDDRHAGQPFVFLHGLTFDRRMWDPVLDALPSGSRAVAFDLPGHGGSAPLDAPGLEPVVDAVHEAVLAAGLEAPIVVGHSIGGPIATIYSSKYPAAAVVSIEASLRLEPFAYMIRELALELRGDAFDRTWASFRAGFRLELVPAAHRELLQAGDDVSQRVVLSYQSDLLDLPLDEVVRRRDEGVSRLRAAAVPYVSVHSNQVDAEERAWLLDRLPQAEIVVWPVGHHFTHLADPGRFAALLGELADRVASTEQTP